MAKKFLSALLAVLMVVSMIPMTAFAAEGDPTGEPAQEPSTPSSEQVVKAPIHDNSESPIADDLLNKGYDLTYQLDQAMTDLLNKDLENDPYTFYSVTLTHPAVAQHKDNTSQKNLGNWVGISVKNTAEKNSHYAGFAVPNGRAIAADADNAALTFIKNKITEGEGEGGYAKLGYSDYTYRQNFTAEGGTLYVSIYTNGASASYAASDNSELNKTLCWVERNIGNDGKSTYNVYNVTINAEAGYVVTTTAPVGGTVTVTDNEGNVLKATDVVPKGTSLTITAEPAEKKRIKVVKAGDTPLTANAEGNYTTTANADVTITAEFENEASIVSVGYRDDAEKARKVMTDAWKALTESESATTGNDSDKQTMWIMMKDLKSQASVDEAARSKDYKVVVKRNGTKMALKEGSPESKIGPGVPFTVIGATGKINIYWTFNQAVAAGVGTVVQGGIEPGTYEFQLEKDGKPVEGVAETLKITKLTVIKGEDDKDEYFLAHNATAEDQGVDIIEPTPETGFLFRGWEVNGDDANLVAQTEIMTKIDTLKAEGTEITEITIEPVFSKKELLKVEAYEDTLFGEETGAELAEVEVAGPDANNKFTVTGTSKWTTDYTDFSSVPEQQYGNYVAVMLTTEIDGAVIKVKSPTEGDVENGGLIKTITGGTGVWVINLKNFKPDFAPEVEVYESAAEDAELKGTYTVDFSGVTRDPPEDDAEITAIDIETIPAAIVPDPIVDQISEASIAPAEVKITVSGDTEDTALNSVTVKLTVPETATVKTTTDEPTDADSYSDPQDNVEGIVTISTQDLSEDKALYVKVTAQDCVTVYYYKIFVEKSDIAVSAPVSDVKPNENIVADSVANAQGIKDAIEDAAKHTVLNSDSNEDLQMEALKAAETNDDITQEAANQLFGDDLPADTDASIYVVPTVEVAPETFNPETKEYKVDITPIAYVYATIEETFDETKIEESILDGKTIKMTGIELENLSVAIKVDIGIPTSVANDGENVIINHYSENWFETVGSNKVTIEVSSFSPYVITPVGGAVLTNVTLTPSVSAFKFDPAKKDYSLTVNGGNITVTPVAPTGLTATVKVGGETVTGPITLATGANVITIEVTEEDPIDSEHPKTATYTITITRVASTGDSPAGGPGGGGGTTTPSYPVQAPAATTGGNVTVTPTIAKEGDTVTVTVTPDTGYEVDKVTVTDASGNAVAAVSAGNGKYTFTMPKSAVTVSASFKKTGGTTDDWKNPYTDVKSGDWFYDAVEYVTKAGLMEGIGNGKFAPNTNLTRAQFAQILYNKAGKPAVSGTSGYSDVVAGAWYEDAIIWASKNNIMAGYTDGTARPNKNISREELAQLLWRYTGSNTPTSTTLNFPDANKVGSSFKTAMLWAVENGVISGNTSSNGVVIDPQGVATRAQAAQMLMNYYNK